MTRPLEGLKVLDLAWVVAGPVIGRTLADYGATVVRVETRKRVDTSRVMGPFPDGRMDVQQSALFENCNAGKLGLTLDLASAGGQQVARDLARWADVVVESFSPGQMRRWGLDYDALSADHPDLIMLSTSLMGQTGPYAQFAGYGNIGAAMAGFQQLVGWPGELPVGPFGPYTDYVGPRFSVVALLAALDHRRRTGEGAHLDVSQAEAGMQFLAPQIAAYSVNGSIAQHDGNRDPEMAPHAVFRCLPDPADLGAAQESWIAIVARNDAEWQTLARLIGGEPLATDPRWATLAQRKADENALEAIVGAWCARHTAHDAQQMLQAAGVPAHMAASSRSMIDDPQLRLRGHFVALAHPLMGTSTVEASRYRLSATPGGPERCAPTYGRDNDEVLRGLLGYSDAEIEALEGAGVLN